MSHPLESPRDDSSREAIRDAGTLRRVLDHPPRPAGWSASRRQPLGQLLVSEGLITPGQLEEALEIQRRHGGKLAHILEALEYLDETAAQQALARQLGLPFVDLEEFDIDDEAVAAIPPDLALRHTLIPILRHNNHLVVALRDPTDIDLLDNVRFIANHPVEPVVATATAIERAIDSHYRDDQELLDSLPVESDPYQSEELLRAAEKAGQEPPIVRLVNHFLIEAVHQRASDIHLRPYRDRLELLFRIDGTLIHMRDFAKRLHPAIVARIKVIGRMNLAERRLPQDGRARIQDQDHEIDLRISVIPTVNGESVVIRLLDTRQGLRTIDEIGFSSEDARRFRHLISHNYGIVLVTGPTGSGKSTTLYAALQEIRQRNDHIITVEDPVEYRIDGVEQIQVNTAPGYSFARALRHILRHDPDVIMIGEIRDTETARIAIESALTGHLVLSTLHTNSAAATLQRLIEMGIESYYLNAALLGVLAQRLMRMNCPHCRVPENMAEDVRQRLGVGPDERFLRGAGCRHCHGTGFKGRMAVCELLEVTAPMRSLIREDARLDEIRQQAVRDGMRPLTESALAAARAGKIPLSEVYRIRIDEV